MVTLLITGAIDISIYKIPSTAVVNVESRLKQYLDSIRYAIYNYKRITHVVFCENTNFEYDYSHLKEEAQRSGKQLEVLSFQGNYSKIQERGKGYGEGEIIDYAIDHSEILKKCTFFYKLTGRLLVTNMDEIIRTTISANAFDFHSGKLYNRTKDHVETIFYKTDKKLYLSSLRNIYNEVDESRFIYLEHLFYERLKKSALPSFRIFPRLLGQSGTTGGSYEKKKGEIILERFYYKTGIHNLQKNIFQKSIFIITLLVLGLWRKLK